MTPNSHKLRAIDFSQFASVIYKEISQIIKQAVLEIHEGYEIQFEVFTGKAFSVWLEFVDETGEKVFCLQRQIN